MPTVLSRPMTSLNHSNGYQWPTTGQAKSGWNSWKYAASTAVLRNRNAM